jgi:NAD-dependent dihydropyrimidine dehydrogenase PreA subunit
MIYVDGEKCAGCGVCEDVCLVEAVRVSDDVACIDQDRCNECEACVEACPNEAILVVIEPAKRRLSRSVSSLFLRLLWLSHIEPSPPYGPRLYRSWERPWLSWGARWLRAWPRIWLTLWSVG